MPRISKADLATALTGLIDDQQTEGPWWAIKNLGPETRFFPMKGRDDIRLEPYGVSAIPEHMTRDAGIKRAIKGGMITEPYEVDEMPEEPPPEPPIPDEFNSLSRQYVQAARQLSLQPDSEAGQKTMHYFDDVTEANILKKYGVKTNRAEAAFLKNTYPDVLSLTLFLDLSYGNLSKAQRKHVTERERTLRTLAAQYLPFL